MSKKSTKKRSLSLDEPFVEFIEKELENHKIERQRDGKDISIVSVIREALFLWAEKEGVLDKLLKFLESKE